MPETREEIRHPFIKEIYCEKATFMFSKEQLQESENRILEGIKTALDKVKKTDQIEELECFSSDPKERPRLGKYAVIKEVIIDEVFRGLGFKEKEAKKFTKGEDVITLWPTKKEGVFARKEEGLFENRRRYTKGVVIAGPEKTIEDVGKKLIEEIKEKKKE